MHSQGATDKREKQAVLNNRVFFNSNTMIKDQDLYKFGYNATIERETDKNKFKRKLEQSLLLVVVATSGLLLSGLILTLLRARWRQRHRR